MMSNSTTLVIMAAGLGSRFGKGIKQLEHVGPNGEILMDYSIYDAIAAGFDKVVVVIRKDIEDEFRKLIGDKVSEFADVSYVYQDIENIPEGYLVPEGRVKPWGTGHAVLSCIGFVDTPFVVINADDFYGREAFVKIHDYLVNKTDSYKAEYCMAGYVLENTLSDNGTVTRGICKCDADMKLCDVEETFELVKEGDTVKGRNKNGDVSLAPDSLVSMNMWGCNPRFLEQLEEEFEEFLSNDEDPLKKEFLLPIVMDKLIKNGKAEVEVLPVSEKWFGLTYHEDKDMIVEKLKSITEAGVYPENLWK